MTLTEYYRTLSAEELASRRGEALYRLPNTVDDKKRDDLRTIARTADRELVRRADLRAAYRNARIRDRHFV